MDAIPYEIERKYLIRYPDLSRLELEAARSEIVQTYLVRPEDGGRSRVRKRSTNGKTTYTHTVKKRVNELRSEEWEREIDEEEYARLLKAADPERATLHKTRYCLPYRGHVFEIDVYPFWKDRAVMEVELRSEDEAAPLPPEIEVVREVSGEKEYSNSSLAKRLAKLQKETEEAERM